MIGMVQYMEMNEAIPNFEVTAGKDNHFPSTIPNYKPLPRVDRKKKLSLSKT